MVPELDLNKPERPNTAYGWKELGQLLLQG
jgi:hypothetical protein